MLAHNKTPSNSLFRQNEYTEYRLICNALHFTKQPLSRRKIAELTGLELPTLCRALYNLTYTKKVLEIAQIKPCEATGRNVYHYYFKKEKGAANGPN